MKRFNIAYRQVSNESINEITLLCRIDQTINNFSAIFSSRIFICDDLYKLRTMKGEILKSKFCKSYEITPIE